MSGMFFALSRTAQTTAVTAAAFAYIFALFFSAYQINYIKNNDCKNNGGYHNCRKILCDEFKHGFSLLMQRDDVTFLSGQV